MINQYCWTHPTEKSVEQRMREMDTKGFYGDTFSSGFGDFFTAKRNNHLE